MYTVIFMSSRGNSVHQHVMDPGRVLFFSLIIFAVFLAMIGGLGYGFFQNHQKASSDEKLHASVKENNKLKLELAGVNEEMKDIRQMVEKIEQALGILGQGGGDNSVSWASDGSADTQQENISAKDSTSAHTDEKPDSLTPSLLKREILPLYDYVSEHEKKLDGHPSILPVKLQQENGEKYGYWYSSGFGWRVHPLTKRREFHKGLDIKTRSGVPVIAAADGTVTKIERGPYLGKTIEINHEGNRFKTLYAHLKDYAEGLKVGQKVTRDQIIGYVGNTGRSTGAHLHYGVYDMETKKWVNPIQYILDQQPTFSP